MGTNRRFLFIITLILLIIVVIPGNVVKAQDSWTKYAGNPVLTDQSGAWDANGISMPAILQNGSTFLLWYVGYDSSENGSIGYATSPNGSHWNAFPANPVLQPGTPESWESTLLSPSVMKEGATYKMWYTGYSGTTPPKCSRIGYATSTDGIHWTKYAGNPVLDIGPSGAWDSDGAGHCVVIKDGSLYKMWYGGSDSEQWWRIGYATSTDGIHWTKYAGNPVLREGAYDAWDEWGVDAPTVIKESGIYRMLYGGIDAYDGAQIGYATSTDGMHWTKGSGNPQLTPGPGGAWDSKTISHPTLLKDPDNSLYKLFYRGEDGSSWGIGYATTTETGDPSAPTLAAPDYAQQAVTFGSVMVKPKDTMVEIQAGRVFLHPTLLVPGGDVGRQANLFVYIYLPQIGAGFSFNGSGAVSLGSELIFSSVFPDSIDLSDQDGQIFDVYYGYVLADGTLKYNAYEVLVSEQTGAVTGNPLQCDDTLESVLIPLIDAMEKKGTKEWYGKAKHYVESYRDEDGNVSPLEAYSLLMWAAYLSDNVYPFCWASLNGLLIDPDDPLVLNSAVVGLFELGEIDLAGRLLDCAVNIAPEFPLTWDNVAFYYDLKGDVQNAIRAKEKAVGANGGNEHPHAAWDGYHYAKSKGLYSAAASFDQNIPSNYGLLKDDGSTGAGKPILRVCCSCSGEFFNDVTECVDNCHNSLKCFTNICTPNVMCCDLNGVFSVEGGICYPPGGAQVCIEVDHDGNATLKAGADLLIIEAYAGATSNFKNKHSVFIEAKSLGQKVKGYVYNSDPHAKTVETTFSPSKSWDPKSLGKKFGISLGVNFDHGKILRSFICAAQN